MSIFKKEVLSKDQLKVLPIIRKFKRSFYLAGGTAIALYAGHRKSVDFDLFTNRTLDKKYLDNRLKQLGIKYKLAYQTKQEWTIFIKNVKVTFYNFPENIKPDKDFENIIKIPSLLDLAAMKAFTIGERAKWKDYVDLYFIIKDFFPIKKIINNAYSIFQDRFNEKLFREQLTYFDDINFSEPIEYLVSEPDNETIKNFLINAALH
ncbi:Hypothetical protein IALB_2640 [Ignavibacterium album JCM 16511]|uniref:Nucleotidyl transferase AbiEii/AbiGii toxin family protein n=1 Tax=Ignavibacterium album (strain DSM 19864 / JCM 16511 / NBRC 101810 / Mat9-16) TaxID=945713 RepID=I0AMY6_IGNAJ|nr:nucleotidyl transferase AbiEii/AbiGii toxin family protein [Ignavibacterium album]AFH50343.1 Hypothetical protein IALB_2640 [Ignavibacterium album JCM 16511]